MELHPHLLHRLGRPVPTRRVPPLHRRRVAILLVSNFDEHRVPLVLLALGDAWGRGSEGEEEGGVKMV